MLKKIRDLFTGGEDGQERRENIKKLGQKEEERKAQGKELKGKQSRRLEQMKGEERWHIIKVLGGSLATVVGIGAIAFLASTFTGNSVETEKKENNRDRTAVREGDVGSVAGTSTSSTSQSGESNEELANPGRVSFTPINFNPPATVEIQDLMTAQAYWKRISLHAMNRFARSDVRASKYKRFMEQNAVFPLPRGPVVTQLLMTGTREEMDRMMANKNSFEVVYMPSQYARGMASAVLTETGGKTVRVAETFEVEEWLGILLLHELSHVWDQLKEGENSRNRDEYLAGEVKAHLFERDLLKIWGPAQFEYLVEKGGNLAMTNRVSEFIDLADTLFPLKQLKGHEQALATASCMISVIFEVAQRRGASNSDLNRIYVNIVSRNRRPR